MPPRVKSAAESWGPMFVAIASAIASGLGLASLPGKFDAMQCRLEALATRIEYLERRDVLTYRDVERRPIANSGDRLP